MKKSQFKQEIENFLNEIETRKQEVSNNNLISTLQVGKSLLDFARTNFKSLYPLVYSVKGIRLDYIFHLGSKSQLHNASNWVDVERLINALKYQIIANKTEYANISLDDFYYVYWGYLVRLMKNFNWTSTCNVNGTAYYLNWLESKPIFSNDAVEALYNLVIVNGNNTVKDINGEKKEINIKNSDYNTMKKLSKEQIIDIIKTFDSKPTVKQIFDVYDASLDSEADDYNDKYVSKELMRHYIKSYELDGMIKTCNHSESFNNKKAN